MRAMGHSANYILRDEYAVERAGAEPINWPRFTAIAAITFIALVTVLG